MVDHVAIVAIFIFLQGSTFFPASRNARQTNSTMLSLQDLRIQGMVGLGGFLFRSYTYIPGVFEFCISRGAWEIFPLNAGVHKLRLVSVFRAP